MDVGIQSLSNINNPTMNWRISHQSWASTIICMPLGGWGEHDWMREGQRHFHIPVKERKVGDPKKKIATSGWGELDWVREAVALLYTSKRKKGR